MEQAWSYLYNTYIKVLNDLAPNLIKENIPFRDEWVSNNTLNMRERDLLQSRLRYSYDDKLHDEFKTARNLAGQFINQDRANYIKEGLTEDQYAPKKYWKRLKQLRLFLPKTVSKVQGVEQPILAFTSLKASRR